MDTTENPLPAASGDAVPSEDVQRIADGLAKIAEALGTESFSALAEKVTALSDTLERLSPENLTVTMRFNAEAEERMAAAQKEMNGRLAAMCDTYCNSIRNLGLDSLRQLQKATSEAIERAGQERICVSVRTAYSMLAIFCGFALFGGASAVLLAVHGGYWWPVVLLVLTLLIPVAAYLFRPKASIR